MYVLWALQRIEVFEQGVVPTNSGTSRRFRVTTNYGG
jgi:hypothetical protein